MTKVSLRLNPYHETGLQARLGFLNGISHAGCSRNLRNPPPNCAVLGALEDCRIRTHLRPAFRKMAFANPIGTSRPMVWTGTVTLG